jgi:hypothetical protein
MSSSLVTNMTQLRTALRRSRPGDVIEHRAGTLRPRIPIIVPAGATLDQQGTSIIDEKGNDA